MGLEEGSRQVLRSCLNLQENEKVLILADTTRDAVGVALFEAASEMGADPVLAMITPRPRPHADPPWHLGRVMEDCDVIILATSLSMTHSRARRAASRAGARVVSLPAVTEDMLSEGALTADHLEIQQVMHKLGRRVRGSRSVRITTGAGTDLTLDVRGRDWVTQDTGLCRNAGDVATLPAGEMFVVPVEDRSEGRLVIDVSFAEALGTAATVMVKGGVASAIVGAQAAVLEMNRGGKEGRVLAKFGIGLNPKARLTGPGSESGKALGGANLAFGDNVAFGGKNRCGVRVDAVIREPSVEVDGRLLVERGRFVV